MPNVMRKRPLPVPAGQRIVEETLVQPPAG
jgi:hypothetical protein